MDINYKETLVLKYGIPTNCNSFLLDTNINIIIGDKLLVYLNNSDTPDICTVIYSSNCCYSIDKVFDSIFIERKYIESDYDYSIYIPLLLKSNVTQNIIIEKQQKQIQFLTEQIQFLIDRT